MYSSVLHVGFESPRYYVNETDGQVTVCILVIRPSTHVDLLFEIVTQYRTRTGSAGKSIAASSCVAMPMILILISFYWCV